MEKTMAKKRKRTRRGGMVLLVILVGLALLLPTAISVLSLLTRERQSLTTQWRQTQATALAESAMGRAAARLAEPGYHGETWRLSAEELGGADAAVVTIRIEEVAGEPQKRLIHVEADFPDDPHARARYTRDTTIIRPKTI
jgi:hypothetical protein